MSRPPVLSRCPLTVCARILLLSRLAPAFEIPCFKLPDEPTGITRVAHSVPEPPRPRYDEAAVKSNSACDRPRKQRKSQRALGLAFVPGDQDAAGSSEKQDRQTAKKVKPSPNSQSPRPSLWNLPSAPRWRPPPKHKMNPVGFRNKRHIGTSAWEPPALREDRLRGTPPWASRPASVRGQEGRH